MADVLIRDLDEADLERLKPRAHAGGRSLEAELRRILQRAVLTDTACPSRAQYRTLAVLTRDALALGEGHWPDRVTSLAEDRGR